MNQEPISVARRKEIFFALVDAQDRAKTVSDSRKLMAKRFGVTDAEIKQIEREGLDNEWPPLE